MKGVLPRKRFILGTFQNIGQYGSESRKIGRSNTTDMGMILTHNWRFQNANSENHGKTLFRSGRKIAATGLETGEAGTTNGTGEYTTGELVGNLRP